eukprot:10268088-Alexandrium_andersonii.AAC.1
MSSLTPSGALRCEQSPATQATRLEWCQSLAESLDSWCDALSGVIHASRNPVAQWTVLAARGAGE